MFLHELLAEMQSSFPTFHITHSFPLFSSYTRSHYFSNIRIFLWHYLILPLTTLSEISYSSRPLNFSNKINVLIPLLKLVCHFNITNHGAAISIVLCRFTALPYCLSIVFCAAQNSFCPNSISKNTMFYNVYRDFQ